MRALPRIVRWLSAVSLLVAVAFGGLFALGTVEKWRDPGICWGWVPDKILDQKGHPLPFSKQPEAFKSGVRECARRRSDERSGPFHAFRHQHASAD